MNKLENKKILLVICGGIAAYKSLELIRLLKKMGASVKTVLTKNAQKFVTPLSITSLSQDKVYYDLFSHENESEMDHISLSRWADLILIAPITANTISKLSYGLADDLATTLILASNKKVFLAPAMNVRMWKHPSNKKNVNKLIDYGYNFIGPEVGDMACGEYGEGKMTEPENIINIIIKYFENLSKNKKLTALVTAGPTHEMIDPVRFISNKSSGKQGYEIANSLKNNGFKTTLISGPTNLNPSNGINLIKVNTAEDMLNKCLECLPVDIAIFTAAVADYRVKRIHNQKIKKQEKLKLDLEKNVDILKHVSNHNSLRPKLVIGFAAETNNLKENSKKKLLEKNCDWIISNDVSNPEIGFNSENNKVSIFYKNQVEENLPKMSKSAIANEISNKIISYFN
jgi:phosphopantothenoylcysteine decarboxylase/phosphopantothenate--cysteine ligase